MWRTSKLVGCPCCKSEAEYDELHTVSEGSDCFFCEHHSYIVRCKGCGLTLISRVSKADAILKWNTRKPMQEIVDRLEEQYGVKGYDEEDVLIAYEQAYIHIDEAIAIVKEVGGTNE